MSKKTSPSLLQGIRYGVDYTERYFKYIWRQTGWVWDQGNRYLSWVKRQHIHPVFRVTLYFFIIAFALLWVLILIFGIVRAI